MSRGIERLSLRCFRGATGTTELRFRPGARLVVVCGENGSGKSTVVDAIDAAGATMVFTGRRHFRH